MLFNTLRLTVKCLQCSNSLRSLNLRTISQVQRYSDVAYRRPVRVVNEEEILEKIEEANGPNEFLEVEKRKPLKVRSKKGKLKKKIVVTKADTPLKEDGRLNYSELKENDPLLMNLMMSVRSRKTRDKNSRVILEGHRLITDALDAGSVPEIIIFSRIADALKLPLPDVGVKLYKTPYRAIQTWSTLTTSPGVMGFFKTPDVESIQASPEALPLTVICDNVREPGNLGSILRACAAVGCKQLILVKGCVDLWDAKVLRSASGAHFRMPIFATRTWREVRTMIDPSAQVWVADNDALVLEKETGAEVLEEDEGEVLDDTEDSQILVEKSDNSQEDAPSPDEYESFEAQDELFKSVEQLAEFKNYRERERDAKLAKKLISTIPIIPYYSTNYQNNENIIIVGGETEGVSLEALALVHERNGLRLNIPMTNGVESLNTGMALGIIAFEMKRQFSVRKQPERNDESHLTE
ncbi:rRNA methyltransferase 3, mitochondrial [Diachasma alloeum]|uniref:rRNA methyltransferase 3, mitochondrial n=1 Tax=Diachasma alloeum TaxID=454923 RepID=UPI00073834E9|nr:rRNA methyltransferase 3, mitochondrial [Diachasma alloeum]